MGGEGAEQLRGGSAGQGYPWNEARVTLFPQRRPPTGERIERQMTVENSMPRGRTRSTRIVAWNIRAGGGTRAEEIIDVLARWRPGIVVLSEFRGTPPSQRIARALVESGLHHQRSTASRDDPARNALLVASRYPLRRLRRGNWPADPQRWLGLRVATPEPIFLGAVHVPNRVSGRKERFLDSLVDVARRWRDRPSIVIGDTNTGWPGADEAVLPFNGYERRCMSDLSRLGWRDAYRDRYGDEPAPSWYSPNAGNGFRLDQAIVSAALTSRVRRTSYHWPNGEGRGPSDHAALRVELT